MAGAIQKKTNGDRKRGVMAPRDVAPELDDPRVRPAAMKPVLAGMGRAIRQARDTQRPVRLTITVRPDRTAPTVDVEATAVGDDLDDAIAEARTRGAARAAEILASPEMLSADDFARLIGVTREAVRQKAMRREALGLQGAKRGVRYPAWQVTRDGGLLPELPRLFAVLGDSPWTVYRFLTQSSPAFKGAPPLEGLRAGAMEPVLEAAEGIARGDFG
ncbi:MAG: hypothetical protein ABI306_03765 [Caulobacteraceae bacterium]